MTIEFGLTDTDYNTEYAPLAVLINHYQQKQWLKPLEKIKIDMKTVEFTPSDKLEQVLVSIMAGCETISQVNTKLKCDWPLAQACGWQRIADQSTLSEALDALTLTNIDQLRNAVSKVWREHSATLEHDWRSYLWLDCDLSGLPCSKRSEGSQKGYFSGKKTSQVGNWPA